MVRNSRVIDLSHDLFVNMPSYPNLPPFKIKYLKLAAKDCSTVSLITSMHTHLGTHIDFPSHVLPLAASLDSYRSEDLCGEGVVVDFTNKKEGTEITERDLLKYNRQIKEKDILFLFSGWSRRRSSSLTYLFKWPHLSLDAAEFLVKKRIRMVGIDGLSVGGWGGKKPFAPTSRTPSRTIHKILLGAGILLLEEVANLDRLLMHKSSVRSFFVVAPLLIKGAEAAPCKVFSILSGPGNKERPSSRRTRETCSDQG